MYWHPSMGFASVPCDTHCNVSAEKNIFIGDRIVSVQVFPYN